VWSAASTVALSGTSTVTPDMNAGINFTFTATTNTPFTLANPTNATKVGQSGFIRVAQPASGSPAAISYGSNWKPVGGSAQSLTATVGKVDVIFYVITGSNEIAYNIGKAII